MIKANALLGICFSIQFCFPFSEMTLTLGGRDQLLAELQPRLEALDIYSRGRFGGWKYEVSNQDHAFMQLFEPVPLSLDFFPFAANPRRFCTLR